MIMAERSSISMSGSISDRPLIQIVETFAEPRPMLVPAEIRDQIDAALSARRAPLGLAVEIVVDDGKIHFGMVEDVVHCSAGPSMVLMGTHRAGAANAGRAAL